ncbi:MAG: FAD-dependent oxidoreductase [Planctomycetota bacterium]
MSEATNQTAVNIQRDLAAAMSTHHDLVVVGGGIYGACLALEAAQRGKRVVMLERGDFGGEVSFNSLRILHGGLRYLQKMDLKRFYESVGERRWFLQHFPDVTQVLPCMMPLYGDGLRRASVFQVALRMNDAMSCRRNVGVQESHHLGRAKVISAQATADRFPLVDRDGLKGTALWEDGQMINSQRVMMELCRWASACGATLLNYVEATGLETKDGRVAAVQARDIESGEELRFEADTVVNAAGPWCNETAEAMGSKYDGLFKPGLAFNVLFDREPMSDCAVAVTAKEPGARTFFLHHEGGKLLGGTYHTPAPPPDQRTGSAFDAYLRPLVADYIDQVNRAVPGLDLRTDQVLRVYPGLLPVANEGDAETTDHPVLHDHASASGPKGLWSVSGVKYTTARLVAEHTLVKAMPGTTAKPMRRPSGLGGLALADGSDVESAPWADVVDTARQLCAEESVRRLDDLLIRRTAWARDPDVGRRLAEKLGPELRYDTSAIEACCRAIGYRPFEQPADSREPALAGTGSPDVPQAGGSQ